MGDTNGLAVIGAAVPSLVRWGCSADADLVYRTLVMLGPHTERELLQDLGVTSARIDHAIDELLAMDAVVSRPGAPGAGVRWAARPHPEVVAGLHRRKPRLLADTGAAAVALPAALTLGDGLRHLPTRDAARERMGRLVRMASREHLAMHPDRSFPAESVRVAAPMDRTLLDRGVRTRVLGVLRPDAVPQVSVRRAGAERRPEYRQAPTVPMKLIVVDRQVALFPVDPRDLEKGYLEVTQAPVVSALADLFERQWAGAWDPWEDAMAGVQLSEREQALVALLAEGYTDATAAEAMGISARSVSNILRHLMDRLDVENRFQLGVALGALRMVPPPRGKNHSQGAQW